MTLARYSNYDKIVSQLNYFNMRKFVNFYDEISAIQSTIFWEIVYCFKDNNVTKISIDNDVCPLILNMFDEWGKYGINETITDVEVETSDSGMVQIKLYKDNSKTFFELEDCTDGNALLYIYEYVFRHFYGEE